MSSSILQKIVSLLGIFLIALTASNALAQATPPGRVARLSLMEGEVSFASAGSDDWSQAEFNRPLTNGDRLQTAPGARAELHSGSTALRINGQTALEISEQGDNATRLTLTQGALSVRVRNLYPGETLEINTPNLAFTASQPGEYRLDVDPNYGTTAVMVRSGSGMVYGENGASRALGSQQQVRFADQQLAQVVAQNNPPRDNFDLWSFARDRAEDQSLSARYVSRDTIGYQQLDDHGDWRTDREYGAVWFPRVAVGQWAPYQNGQWRWIAPWGWTWVDNAPWGFAPFHYGRWAQIGAQWAWVPGPMNQRPSYAPALVRFEGFNRFDQDRRNPPQGNWFPLAPDQPWRPSYPMDQRPFDSFNRPQRPPDRDRDWNRAPRPFGNGPTRVEPMVQPPPQPIWPQQAIPHPRPEMRMQESLRSLGELEQRGQMQRQQQIDRERQQQEQNRNQMQQQSQSQREQIQRQRDAAQQQMQQQQQLQQQMRDQQNRQQQQQQREQSQRDAQAQQQQQDRQRQEQARPMPRPQMVEPQIKPPEPYSRPLIPGQRRSDSN